MDAILFILIVAFSASVAIVIFRAYEKTTARLVDVVESNTKAMQTVCDGIEANRKHLVAIESMLGKGEG